MCWLCCLFLLLCLVSTASVILSQEVLNFPHGETKAVAHIPWYPPYIYQPLNPDGELCQLEAVFFDEVPLAKHNEVQWTVVYSDEKMQNPFLNALYFIFRAMWYGRVRDIETFYTYGNASCWAIDFQGVSVCDGAIFSGVPQEHCFATIVGGENRTMDVYIRTWNHLMGAEPTRENGVRYERVKWLGFLNGTNSTKARNPFNHTIARRKTRIGRAAREEIELANAMPWGKRYLDTPREPELKQYVQLCE